MSTLKERAEKFANETSIAFVLSEVLIKFRNLECKLQREKCAEEVRKAWDRLEAQNDRVITGLSVIIKAILAAEDEPVKWCEHMLWCDGQNPRWYFRSDAGDRFLDKENDARWKLCPICGTPKPERKP